MGTSKKISPYIVIIIVYCLLASAKASMTFGSNPVVEFVAAIICFLYFYSEGAIKATNATITASALVVVSCMFTIHGGSIAGYISYAMNAALIVVVLNLRYEWRIELLSIISRWFAVLLSISIIAWLLHFVVPLPHTTSISESAWGYLETIHNYYIFKILDNGIDTNLRFQAMFLEPGHLGTIVTFFLMANRFDFKRKYNLVFLIAAILSLSASAYLLLALGYVLYRFSENGSKRLIIASLFVGALVIFFINYKGGNNVVNELIFSKLTREEGAIESRSSIEVLTLYENMWSTGNDLLFGKGAFAELKGAGFYLYFVCNGIIGCILLLLAYTSIYLSCKSRYGFFVLIVYIVSFLQRTYPYWDIFIMPFILGLPYFKLIQFSKKELPKLKVNK